MFFPEGWRRDDIERARRYCAGCPVRADCLAYALSWPVSQDMGIWGGTTELERRALRKTIRIAGGSGT